MKVLFVTSEHPANLYGGLGTFTREYVKELRKYADVVCVYFHMSNQEILSSDDTVDFVFTPERVFEASSLDAQILETAASFRAKLEPIISEFKPDIIHCNDRQTYLPFRFDKNVFYSSHLIFADLLGNSVLNDMHFQEMKVERCAVENSSVLAVYSDFAAKSVSNLSGGKCFPIVLPLGLRTEKFLKNPRKKMDGNNLYVAGKQEHYGASLPKKRKVYYFGRFENIQKGLNDFIYAVNTLGEKFKKDNNIEYGLFGRGEIAEEVDLSLFDKIDFLQGDELIDAYKKADIVVMPSRYEPFGFTGLEAMASGCLVLLPTGLGMDMYAFPGYNCLEIPHDVTGIANVLKDAVENFETYKVLRENAEKTASAWTWKRCVMSHLYIYRLMAKGRLSQLYSAYSVDERDMLKHYKNTSDVEILYHADEEKNVSMSLVNEIRKKDSEAKILVLSGCYKPEMCEIPKGVEVFSVLNEGKDGIVVRPECLPFDDKEFDYVICAGAWETVIEPCLSVVEMQRVCKKDVMICYYKGSPLSWQTFQMECDNDWEKLTSNSYFVNVDESDENGEYAPYGVVRYCNHLCIKEKSSEKIA